MDLPINYNEAHWTVRKQAREQYIKNQEGKCCHCKEPLKKLPSKEVRDLPVTEELFPEGFFNYPIHLHHCHNTGMTIGAVHSYCNAVLWEYHGE